MSQRGDGTPSDIWIGKRAATKPTWPGRLDSLAAGGLAAGQLPLQAMVAECAEEAGIPSDLASGLRPVSAVSYVGFSQDGWGLKRDVLYCFDLQVRLDDVACTHSCSQVWEARRSS